MYKKGAGNDKQGKDAGNRTLCPNRNFSQAIMQCKIRAVDKSRIVYLVSCHEKVVHSLMPPLVSVISKTKTIGFSFCSFERRSHDG